MTCKICSNPAVLDINTCCSNPMMTDWDVQASFPGLFISDISHHRRGCLGIENEIVEFSREHQQLETTGNRSEVLDRLEALADTAQSILDSAENSALALKALKEIRDTLTAIAKIQGVQQKAADTSMEVEEARALSKALRAILPQYPEAGRALAQSLVTIGYPDMGNQIARFVEATLGVI